MSTVPGRDAWRDAGLIDQDEEVVSLVEEVKSGEAIAPEADEYRPRSPRPDLDARADEADVMEQASVVPDAGDDYV